MSEAWDERKKALEEEYFRRKEQEALEKLRAEISAAEQNEAAAAKAMNCPRCDGRLHEMSFEGVQIDRCDKCGGVWLDAGELETLTKREGSGWFSRMFGASENK